MHHAIMHAVYYWTPGMVTAELRFQEFGANVESDGIFNIFKHNAVVDTLSSILKAASKFFIFFLLVSAHLVQRWSELIQENQGRMQESP